MAEEQQFCLRWNNFQVNITSQFEALRDEEDFVDVTLACEGKRLKAHKVVLSACSPYFKDLFKSNPCKHPILFMRDVEFRHLQSLVEFMYAGEVNVAQAQLSSFLRTAESLQIRGLTEAPQRHKQMESSTQGTAASSPGDNSRANASSPEEEGEEDDVMSLSPPSSPPPAKRQCREQAEDSGQLDNVKSEVPDLVEPKVEVPDYGSDGESKTDSGAMAASFMGLDNSVDMNTSFTGLHGGMEILPGTSTQNFMAETSQDSTQADQRKLHSLDPRPCPICYRMYSNLSNLRQHLRLIHNPQTVACPLCSKPFKTKLYLKRHLMSFHELLCTSPKSGPVVPPTATPGAAKGGEFFPPAPQIVLGQEDKNGFGKGKEDEYFQDRQNYQGSNHLQEMTQYQASMKDSRATAAAAAFLSPTHVGRNHDRASVAAAAAFRLNQSSKSQEINNYLNAVLAPSSNSNEGRYGDRVGQFAGNGQENNGNTSSTSSSSQQQQQQPPASFLSLLSVASKADEEGNSSSSATSFLNPMFSGRAATENAVDNNNKQQGCEREAPSDSLSST